MQKEEVSPYPVLRARRPHATENGAREFARRDGVRRAVRDRRAILIDEVPAQDERVRGVCVLLVFRGGGRTVGAKGSKVVCSTGSILCRYYL